VQLVTPCQAESSDSPDPSEAPAATALTPGLPAGAPLPSPGSPPGLAAADLAPPWPGPSSGGSRPPDTAPSRLTSSPRTWTPCRPGRAGQGSLPRGLLARTCGGRIKKGGATLPPAHGLSLAPHRSPRACYGLPFVSSALGNTAPCLFTSGKLTFLGLGISRDRARTASPLSGSTLTRKSPLSSRSVPSGPIKYRRPSDTTTLTINPANTGKDTSDSGSNEYVTLFSRSTRKNGSLQEQLTQRLRRHFTTLPSV